MDESGAFQDEEVFGDALSRDGQLGGQRACRRFAVVVMDSDFTTFAEVENACIELFGYTPDEAAALSMRVHTTGEAVAVVP